MPPIRDTEWRIDVMKSGPMSFVTGCPGLPVLGIAMAHHVAVEEEVTQHLNQWLHHQMDAVTRPIRDTEWRIDVMMNRQKVAVEAELGGDAHGLRIVGETMSPPRNLWMLLHRTL